MCCRVRSQARSGLQRPSSLCSGQLVFVFVTMCFAAAGSRISATGGPYTYVRAAFGPFASFVIGAVFWVSNIAGAGSLAAALIDQAALFFPSLSNVVPRSLVVIAGYILLSVLNARGIRTSAIAIMVLATIKLVPLVVLAVFGGMHMQAANFQGPATMTASTVGSAMVLVVFCYSGMEIALSPSGEIRNPSRVVPRAALFAITSVVILAVALQIVAQGILGSQLADNPAPLAAVAGKLFPGAYGAVLLAASISMFGILQGDLVGSSRLLYALARDGYLPSALSKVTAKLRVPLPAIAAHAAAVTLLTILGSFKSLALMSGGAMCIVYLGCCTAAWRLQRKDIRDHGTPFMLPGGALIPLSACIALILILTTLARPEWQAIGYALSVVVVLYLITRWRQRRAE